jgi:hypothetical protein
MSDEDQVDQNTEEASDVTEPPMDESTSPKVESVPEPDAVPAPVPEAVPAPDAAPAPMAGAMPDAGVGTGAASSSRTGLVVAIVAVVVILIAAAVGLMWARGSFSGSTGSSTARAKVTTAVGFVEAVLDGDTMAIKPFLTDAAQSAASAKQWAAIASGDTTGLVTFTTPVWTGDTKTFVSLSAQNTTGTMVFTYDAAKPLDVTMLATAGGTTETDTVTLVAAGSYWRVVSIANSTNKTVFDAAMIKSLVPTGTAQ